MAEKRDWNSLGWWRYLRVLLADQVRIVFSGDVRDAEDPSRSLAFGMRVASVWYLVLVGVVPLCVIAQGVWMARQEILRGTDRTAALMMATFSTLLGVFVVPTVGLLVAAKTAPFVARCFGAKWPTAKR